MQRRREIDSGDGCRVAGCETYSETGSEKDSETDMMGALQRETEISRERRSVMRKYRNGKSFQTLCRWKSFYTSSERNAKTMTHSLSSRPGPYDGHQSARFPPFFPVRSGQYIYHIYVYNYM